MLGLSFARRLLSQRDLSVPAAIGRVFGARLVAAGAAVFSTFLVARYLKPAPFAHFMFLLALMNLVEGLVGPPLDTSLVRFAAKHIKPGYDGSLRYFRAVFWVKLAAALTMILVGILGAPWIHEQLITGQEGAVISSSTVTVAFTGGALMILWRYGQAYFQAHQRFTTYARFELLNGVLRLGFVVLLCANGVRSVSAYLGSYVLAIIVVGLLTYVHLPKNILSATHKQSGVLAEFLRFSRWVVCAGICTTLAYHVPAFLLPWFNVPEAERGYYFAALVLVNLGELAVVTVFHVLLPRASQIRDVQEMRRFLNQLLWPCAGLSLALLCVLPFSGFLAQLAYGSEYEPSGIIVIIQSVGVLFTLGSAPAATLILAMGRPHVLAAVEAIKFLAIAVLGYGALCVLRGHEIHAIVWIIGIVRAVTSLVIYTNANRMIQRLPAAGPTASA